MARAKLIRLHESNVQTLGHLLIYEGITKVFDCMTLELADKDNQRSVSRIPAGTYWVEKHNSPKFGKSFWVKDVPGRSEILIHVGNFYRDTRGCVLAGDGFEDIDKDGLTDVTNSKKTINKLYEVLPDRFQLKVYE
jgi:hypothetical protein